MPSKDFSKYYTDECVVRLIAAQVIIIALVSLGTYRIWPVLALTTDFALRAFTVRTSPLAAIAKGIAALLQVKPKPIFAAPKKFAAALGFVFSFLVLLFLLLRLYPAAYVVGGILIFCALLEAVFKICLGCYVYDWLVAPLVNRSNNRNQQTTNSHD